MPRLTAWRILRSGSPAPLREVNRYALAAGLDDRDRGLLRQLIGTEVRHRGTLRAIVNLMARGKPSADVTAHLRLGFAQLFYLNRIPAHAAVSESVRAATDTVGLGRGRYVNGVLRATLRSRRPGSCGDPRKDLLDSPWHFDEPLFRDSQTHPALWAEDALSIPSSLFKRWSKRHGHPRAIELAQQANQEPPLSLVCLGLPREEVSTGLDEAGIPSRPGAHQRVLLLDPSLTRSVLASEPFIRGQVTVQGESALRAAELMRPAVGMRILDLAAAPGGKAVAMAHAGASVVATDISPRRLALMPAALERVGLSDRVRCIASDGLQGLARPGARFDGVFVDAPCSNTGVLAARPGARWRMGPSSLRALVQIQANLLEQAAEFVAPSGCLIYSTCSIEPEEGVQQVRAFLSNHPSWSLEEEHEDLPGDALAGPVDGGYRARLSPQS